MPAKILTPDQVLRVVAAFEAAWKNDDDALVALAHPSPGEEPLTSLIADYGTIMLDKWLLTVTGIGRLPEAEQAQAAETFNASLPGHLADLTTAYLHGWAHNADSSVEAVGNLARAVFETYLSFASAGDDRSEVQALLNDLREEALTRS
ncbi:hypothetical protein ABTY61_22915 [Kitasatospora sp. NPDC096128]|uniref:hypothetical protein n=1 Tax=Kitasatospora sp. NPDC096128 TaxID=3155547 RepID=UPI00331B714B